MNILRTEFRGCFFDGGKRLVEVVFEHGERDVGVPFGAGVLHDHVDRHILRGELREDRQARARVIGHVGDRDLGFVLGQGRAADRRGRPIRCPSR